MAKPHIRIRLLISAPILSRQQTFGKASITPPVSSRLELRIAKQHFWLRRLTFPQDEYLPAPRQVRRRLLSCRRRGLRHNREKFAPMSRPEKRRRYRFVWPPLDLSGSQLPPRPLAAARLQGALLDLLFRRQSR